MAYFVYVLQSERDGSYYIGHTGNLEKRVDRHNRGESGYPRGKLPWKLIYHELLGSKAEAMRREKEIKARKSRKFIEQLVRAYPG
jgi:putative endonuclease